MSLPTDQAGVRLLPSTDRGVWLSLLAAAALLLGTAHCTFPEYETRAPAGDAGSGSTGAAAMGASGGSSSGTAGAGQGASSMGARGGEEPAGGRDAGDGGEPGVIPQECLVEQWPIDECAGTCVPRYADHCYDGELSGNEVDTDCGGGCQRCTIETCTSNEDCLSGRCEAVSGGQHCFAPIALSYSSNENANIVGSTAWTVKLTNVQPEGGPTYALKDLKVRYYISRSGVTEPLLIRSTQANLAAGDQATGLEQTRWSVERTEIVDDLAYDAYVEVSFGDDGQLFPADVITLYQQMTTGDSGRSQFDQRAHYSFAKVEGAASLRLAIFYRGRLIWGLEPRPANPRSCFFRGVNLNGPPLSIAGNAWQGGEQAMVASTGAGVSQAAAPFPEVGGTVATMLQTATRLDAGHSFSLPVDNGTYLLYLYTTSPTNEAETSAFSVQGAPPVGGGKYRAQIIEGAQAWARLGPFRAEVTSGSLSVEVTGETVSFTGLELWYPN